MDVKNVSMSVRRRIVSLAYFFFSSFFSMVWLVCCCLLAYSTSFTCFTYLDELRLFV